MSIACQRITLSIVLRRKTEAIARRPTKKKLPATLALPQAVSRLKPDPAVMQCTTNELTVVSRKGWLGHRSGGGRSKPGEAPNRASNRVTPYGLTSMRYAS